MDSFVWDFSADVKYAQGIISENRNAINRINEGKDCYKTKIYNAVTDYVMRVFAPLFDIDENVIFRINANTITTYRNRYDIKIGEGEIFVTANRVGFDCNIYDIIDGDNWSNTKRSIDSEIRAAISHEIEKSNSEMAEEEKRLLSMMQFKI